MRSLSRRMSHVPTRFRPGVRVRGRSGCDGRQHTSAMPARKQPQPRSPRKDRFWVERQKHAQCEREEARGCRAPLHRRFDHARLGRRRERGLAEVLCQTARREPGDRRRPDGARVVAARSRQPRRHSSQAGRRDDRHEQLPAAIRPEEIADGVHAIVEKLRTKLPQCKVLVLAIFPARSRTPTTVCARSTRPPTSGSRSSPTTSTSFISISVRNSSVPTERCRETSCPTTSIPTPRATRSGPAAIEPTVARLLGESS